MNVCVWVCIYLLISWILLNFGSLIVILIREDEERTQREEEPFGRLQPTLNCNSGDGIKGYYICVSRAKKMQNWEELSKSRTCKSVTQKVKNPAEVPPSRSIRAVGNTWHSELTSENRQGSHKTLLWVLSYLPSLIRNTPLVMSAVQVAARRRYRTLWRSFIASPEPAAVLSPASSVSAGQHSEKRETLDLWV